MTLLWCSIIIATGGLAIVLYGLRLTSDGLRTAFGGQLRTVLTVLTVNRLAGLVAGIFISFLLASSSVVTILLVNLAAAGFLAPRQAIGVVLGCTIGSTFIVQIIAFASTSPSIPLIPVLTAAVVIAGFLILSLARFRRWRAVGSALLGLGLLFLGLTLLGQAFSGIVIHPLAGSAGSLFGGPVAAFVIGLILGAVVRSVAACALVVMLAATGAPNLPLTSSILVVLGANVGTSFLPLVVGLKGMFSASSHTHPGSQPGAGLQVALAEVVIKILGAAVFLLLLQPFTSAVVAITDTVHFGDADIPGRQVANAHTIFNLLTALVFLPLAGPVALLVRKLVPAHPARRARSALLFLDPSGSADPEVSLEQVHSEVHAMGKTTAGFFDRAFEALLKNDESALDRVEADYDRIDLLDAVLTEYLVRLGPGSDGRAKLTDDQVEFRTRMLLVSKTVETLAALATRDLVSTGRRKALAGVRLTPETEADLKGMYRQVRSGLNEMLEFLHNGSGKIESVLAFERDIDGFKQRLQTRQVERISRAVPGELESGDSFINTLDTLRVSHYYTCEVIRILSRSQLAETAEKGLGRPSAPDKIEAHA